MPAAAARRGAYRLRPIAGDSALGTPAFHPQVRTHAELTLPGRARAVALTFDDGPDPDFTPQVLAVLRTYRVQATFFVIGENAAAFPRLLHDIAAGGHVVANHSYTHPQLTTLSLGKVKDELGRTSDVIERVLDAPPRWCRAPYGEWDAPSLRVCARLGMEPLGWSIDTNDWARPGIGSIKRAVTRGIEPGSIILQHDGGGDRSQTVRAVSDYLPRLLDKGYEFVRPHV
ncbi:oligosaccharide deacetylase [Streptomyces sulfonofaciens]|uniref:Oligosaccharide deacetylase n=1 Tax=Streptomyces sulfonofaciens TaxID=68272 RepID=A0A919FVJ5_9ACTN|nr:oligosaccharide deacetylase [Streptomyces sulfonofaciens]